MDMMRLNAFKAQFQRRVVEFLADCNVAAAVVGKMSFHAMFEVLAEGISDWIPTVRYAPLER